jgi:hypothetical protein
VSDDIVELSRGGHRSEGARERDPVSRRAKAISRAEHDAWLVSFHQRLAREGKGNGKTYRQFLEEERTRDPSRA